MKQRWLDKSHIYASLGLNELTAWSPATSAQKFVNSAQVADDHLRAQGRHLTLAIKSCDLHLMVILSEIPISMTKKVHKIEIFEITATSSSESTISTLVTLQLNYGGLFRTWSSINYSVKSPGRNTTVHYSPKAGVWDAMALILT